MKVNNEITEKLVFENLLTKIATKTNTMYSVTNYAVLCDGEMICFCGSDIVKADNISIELGYIFPDKKFYVSEEFPAFD